MSRVDWAAVRFGVVRGTSVALPLAVLAQVLVGDDNDDVPPIAIVLLVGVLLALAFAGWCAAQRTTDAPYASGAVAALGTFLVVQAIGIIAVSIRGDDVQLTGLVFNAMLASACGLLGAAVVVRQRGSA